MRIVRLSELKGVVAILAIVLGLAIVLLALTGKLQKRLGIRLSFGGTYDKIAFVSDRNGHPDIWVMDADGSHQRPLTNDPARDAYPAWSPDGRKILLASDRGTDSMQVFVMRPDGSRLRQVTSSSGAKSLPSFSPDGFSIAYLTAGRVFVVDLTGGHEEPILPTVEQVQVMKIADQAMPYRYVSWASDSRHLGVIQEVGSLQVAQTVEQPGAQPMIVQDLDGTKMVANLVGIAWSKEGLRLAVALATEKKGHLLAVWDIDNEQFFRLLRMSGDYGPTAPDWSPDGEMLAVGISKIAAGGQSEPSGILVVNVADGTVATIDSGPAYQPKWSPNGKSILYTVRKNGRTDIWSYDLHAKKAVNLTRGRGNNHSPAWGPTRRTKDGRER